jgi:hypothetical protein
MAMASLVALTGAGSTRKLVDSRDTGASPSAAP